MAQVQKYYNALLTPVSQKGKKNCDFVPACKVSHSIWHQVLVSSINARGWSGFETKLICTHSSRFTFQTHTLHSWHIRNWEILTSDLGKMTRTQALIRIFARKLGWKFAWFDVTFTAASIATGKKNYVTKGNLLFNKAFAFVWEYICILHINNEIASVKDDIVQCSQI